MNRTQSEIVVPIEKSAHASGNFNCRQAGRMLDVHHSRPFLVNPSIRLTVFGSESTQNNC